MRLRSGLAAVAIVLLTSCATPTGPTPAPAQADAYADHLVGRLAHLRQDYAAAADRYFAALAREPNSMALLNGAVTASLAAGDPARARQAARMAPRGDAPAYALAARAVDRLRAGRFGAAAEELTRAEGSAGEQLVVRTLLVWAQAGQGRVDAVISDLAPLAAIRPYGGLFAYQQAMALDLAGRRQEALAAYAAAAQGGMFLPPAVERHADLLARIGRRDEAIALLQREGNATNPQLVAAQARLSAGEAGTPPLTLAHGAAVGLYGLAAIFHQESDAANALAALTLALMLDGELDAARLLFAQIQASLGNSEAARHALDRVEADSPYAATARVMQAWNLIDAERNEEALTLAGEAAASGEPRARRALADIYRRLERYGEAEPIYTDLIAHAPNDWRLFFSRGAARERMGRWPDAEADFLRALELSPEQPDVMNYLGYTWVDRGERLQEGLALIQRAAELRPQSGAIVDSLGWAYYRLGDYARSVQYLERAVELEPADPILNDHLGDVYWRLGRRIEARFQWRRALSYEPEDPASIEAKLERGLPDEPAAQTATR